MMTTSGFDLGILLIGRLAAVGLGDDFDRALADSSMRKPTRTTAWSSTSMTRIFVFVIDAMSQRQAARVTRVPPSVAVAIVELAAERTRALAHAAHAEVAGSLPILRQAAAVVARLRARAHRASLPMRIAIAARIGVAQRVRHGFLQDAVRRERVALAEIARGNAPSIERERDVRMQPPPFGDALARALRRARGYRASAGAGAESARASRA